DPVPPDYPGPVSIGAFRYKGEGMSWQCIRMAILVAVCATGTALPARAGDCCSPAPCAPTWCQIEWVPETYQTTRTTYRVECKEEAYTAFRCECVPETRTRTCTTYRMVPETRTESCTVCVCVPTIEERTVMQ